MVTARFLARADVDRLIGVLAESGRTVIGPVVSDGAVAYAPITSAADLPTGWTDEQGPGTYRLSRSGDRTFDIAPPAQGLKRYTFPSRVPVSGSTSTARNAGHNGSLAAGATTSFGFLGSTTGQVLRRSPVPLLVLR